MEKKETIRQPLKTLQESAIARGRDGRPCPRREPKGIGASLPPGMLGRAALGLGLLPRTRSLTAAVDSVSSRHGLGWDSLARLSSSLGRLSVPSLASSPRIL